MSKHSSLLLLGSCAASFCLARLAFVATGYLDAPATTIEAPPPLTRTIEAPVPLELESQTHTVPPPATSQPVDDDDTATIPAATPSAPPPPESQPTPTAPSEQGAAKAEIDSPKAETDAPSDAAPPEQVAALSPSTPDIDPEQAEGDVGDPNAASPSVTGEAEAEAAPLDRSDASTPDEKPVTAGPKKAPEPSRQARQIDRTKPERRAMQLAPAAEPIGHATASNYGARVRAMLARHRPVAGARGSATVTFSIGRNGELRSVRISQSSGMARLDQMALATVRNAGPFPTPPANLAGGGLSYSIRIYFR